MEHDSAFSDAAGGRELDPPKPSGPGETPEKSGGVTTIGVLNILFGLVCGCGWTLGLIMMVMLPQLMDGMSQGMQQAFQQTQSRLDAQVETAEAALAEAEAGGNQDEIDAALLARDAAKKRADQNAKVNPAKMFDAMADMFSDRGMQTYNFLSAGGLMLFNVVLVISGIGLLSRRQWARTLAIGSGGFKLLVEVILGVIAVVVMPSIMADFNQTMAEFMANAPGGSAQAAQFQQMSAQMKTQMMMQTIIGALTGCVYPVIVIVVLMQKRAVAEFADWADYYRAGGR